MPDSTFNSASTSSRESKAISDQMGQHSNSETLDGKVGSQAEGLIDLIEKSPRNQQISQLQRLVDNSGRQVSERNLPRHSILQKVTNSSKSIQYCNHCPIQLAKVGIELTFTDNDIQHLSPEKRLSRLSGDALEKEETARETASQKMNAWAQQVGNYNVQHLPPTFKKGNFTVRDNYKGTFEMISKMKGEKFPRAKLVKYTWMEDKQQKSFWWNMDVDPGVLEVQAQPTDTEDLQDNKPISAIMDDDIFGGAAHAGLRTDQQLGGGHVNIDFATGFDSSYKNVLRTFLLAAFDQAYKDLDPEDDQMNNPSLIEPGRSDHQARFSSIFSRRARYDELAEIIRSGLNNPKQQLSKKDMQTIIQRLNLWFRENRTANQNRTQGKSHYQAVNIEHTVHNHNKQDENRVEFRNPDAQEDRHDLLADVGVITAMIDKAKALDQAAIDNMLTQIENQYNHWRPAPLQEPQ